MGWHSGASVGRLGWLQPVESDNIAFLLMPHCRPSPRTRAGGYIFPETKSLLSSGLLNLESLHFLPPILYIPDRSRWDDIAEFHSMTLWQIVSLEGITEMLSRTRSNRPQTIPFFLLLVCCSRKYDIGVVTKAACHV